MSNGIYERVVSITTRYFTEIKASEGKVLLISRAPRKQSCMRNPL